MTGMPLLGRGLDSFAWDSFIPEQVNPCGRVVLCRYFAREFAKLDATELSQRTLTVLARKLPGFEPRVSLTAWMYGVARKRALTELRTRRRKDALEEAFARLVPPRSTMSPTSRLHAHELLTIVLEELTKLPAHHRRAIENMLEGGDINSFAARQRIPPATARTRQFRAIERLRRLVADRLASPRGAALEAPGSDDSSPAAYS